MRKYLILSVLILVFSIVSSFTYVKAYVSPGWTAFVGVTLPIGAGTWQSAWRTKYVDFKSQEYEHEMSSTWLTSDCTDCIVSTDLYNNDGKLSSTVTVKGQVKTMPDSFFAGDYYVKLWRVNAGLLKTTHFGTWYINTSYSDYL